MLEEEEEEKDEEETEETEEKKKKKEEEEKGKVGQIESKNKPDREDDDVEKVLTCGQQHK